MCYGSFKPQIRKKVLCEEILSPGFKGPSKLCFGHKKKKKKIIIHVIIDLQINNIQSVDEKKETNIKIVINR